MGVVGAAHVNLLLGAIITIGVTVVTVVTTRVMERSLDQIDAELKVAGLESC